MQIVYIGYGLNKKVTDKSSSGGLFATLAEYIISIGGVVYGAAMVYSNNVLECKHIRIEKQSDLYKIQGSKYAHSKTEGVFCEIRTDLEMGKTVLFSGTSCQVYALKHFLGENNKLYTVDLVCHGVPKNSIFRDYINFLEKCHKCKITNLKFRDKNKYVLTIQEDKKNGKKSNVIVPSSKSAYYRLFLQRASYRECCYKCKWATIDKPSDITLGDFKPREEEVSKYALNKKEVYSSIIIHTSKGVELLERIRNFSNVIKISTEEMLSHHLNLKQPSVISSEGKRLFSIYNKYGFKYLQKWIDFNNSLIYIYRLITFK